MAAALLGGVTLHHRIRRTVLDQHLPATWCPAYVVHRNAPDAPRASRHFFAVALPPFSAPFREIGDNYMHSKCEGERTSAKRFGDRALYLALDVSGRSPNGTGSVLHTVQGQHISI